MLAGAAPGDDPSEALSAVPAFADALRAGGVPVAAGQELWRALGGELREVGSDLPVGSERTLDDARKAYLEGDFLSATQLAADAVARLERAPRSVAVEARERLAQVLWGLAALSSGEPAAAARAHLFWTLAREPAFALDPLWYARPLRQPLDEARRALSLLPRGSLTVTGAEGASVYVDGLLSGQAPLTVTQLPRHGAWVWLERTGRRSFAHRLDIDSASTSVSVNLDLEASLGMSVEGQPIFSALRGDPETPRLLERLAAAMAIPAVAVLLRCPGSGCWQLQAVSSGRSFSLQHRSVGGSPPPLEDLARELLAEARTGEGDLEPVQPGATAVASVAVEQPSKARAWPWIVAGVAVVAVAAGVGLYFALRSTGNPSSDVGLYSSMGSP